MRHPVVVSLLLVAAAVAVSPRPASASAIPKKEFNKKKKKAPAPKPTASPLPQPKNGPIVPQPATNLPQAQMKPCLKSQKIQLPSTDVFPLAPVENDSDLGDGAYLIVSSLIGHGARAAWLDVTVKSRETVTPSERSVLSHRKRIALPVSVPKGCQIAAVTHDWSSQGYADHVPAHEKTFVPGGPIASARCVAFVNGDDWGKVGCSQIDFVPLEVTFEPLQQVGCDTISLQPDDVDAIVLPTVSQGDAVLGPGTFHRVEARASIENDKDIWLETRVEIEESDGDHTVLTSGWRRQHVADIRKLRPECAAKALRKDKDLSHGGDGFYDSRGHAGRVDRTENGLIRQVSCRIRAKGKGGAVGKVGCYVIFQQMTVDLAGPPPPPVVSVDTPSEFD